MTRQLYAFLEDEAGAARVEAVFAVATLLAVAGVVAMLVMNGGPREREPSTPPPEEVAMAELLRGEILQFSPAQVRQRLDTYLDPIERTDSQLRNAHRTWSQRTSDPRYGDPELANDMFAIIDRAMQIRGVTPHSDI